MLRNLIKTANELIALGYDQNEDVSNIIDGAEKKLYDLMQAKNQRGYEKISDILVDSFVFCSKSIVLNLDFFT